MSEELEEQSTDNEQRPKEQTWNESSAGENIIATDEQQPINDKPETKNMETHAQHLHHAPGKKFRHYLYEFLMLFLAVFCGFLAEYKLEQTIEGHRAKEFAVSLYSDLAADTAEFNSTIDDLAFCVNKIDTLVDLLSHPGELKKNTPAIYLTSFYAFIFPTLSPNESTLQQLLNSGSLRYFRNKNIVKGIKDYNSEVQFIKEYATLGNPMNLDFRKIQLQVIDLAPIVNYMYSDFSYDSIPNMEKALYFSNRKLLTENSNLLNQYANWCILKKIYLKNTISQYARSKSDAMKVLNLIKKEYHLN